MVRSSVPCAGFRDRLGSGDGDLDRNRFRCSRRGAEHDADLKENRSPVRASLQISPKYQAPIPTSQFVVPQAPSLQGLEA